MKDRLDVFIDALLKYLQPHGGCQCGCSMNVLGAVDAAKQALNDSDEEAIKIDDQAYNDATSDRIYGSS